MSKWHSKDFCATNLRGQYTLAYEASRAASMIGIIIGLEQAKSTVRDPQKHAGRVAVLSAAKAMLDGYATQFVTSALSIRDDFLEMTSSEPSSED